MSNNQKAVKKNRPIVKTSFHLRYCVNYQKVWKIIIIFCSAYANTVQEQLFEELQTKAKQDGTLTQYMVQEIMDTWTLKSGFPIVTVRKLEGNIVQIFQV